ncbi:hypothetical protein L1049_023176 [Liquidambar formosana]|uniref:Pectinesterase inhibitor domain-containing protein n=1 Tax=Liquidambar formosana TaxID=63359 RepID=A0AAP0WPM1_LIQFO
MDSSMKSYCQADVLEEQAFFRQTRKRLIIITLSTIIFVTLIVGLVVGTLTPQKSSKSSTDNPLPLNDSAEAINTVCNVTQYPDSCIESISSLKLEEPDPEQLFKLSLQVALNELLKLSSLLNMLMSKYNYISENDPLVQEALHNCESLIEDAVDQINTSILSMQVSQGEMMLSTSKINDMRTWLSTATTDQETCLDGVEETAKGSMLTEDVRHAMRNSTEFTSNSLAIISNILTLLNDSKMPIHRKLMGVGTWVPSIMRQGNPFPRKAGRDL